MQEIKRDLELICEMFNLGTLLGFRSEKDTIEGYEVATFNTSQEKELKYIFKTKI